jgi:hypothetical protein
VRAVSKKKAARDREYAKFRREFLAARDVCEKCGQARAVLCHHRRRRSRQGALTLEQNCSALCDECHTWIHANPDEANQLGWLVREGDPEWDELGAP